MSPRLHWVTTAVRLPRIMREIRRRTPVVGAFPDGTSAPILVAARLRYMGGTRRGTRKYLDLTRLYEQGHDEKFKGHAQQNGKFTLTQ